MFSLGPTVLTLSPLHCQRVRVHFSFLTILVIACHNQNVTAIQIALVYLELVCALVQFTVGEPALRVLALRITRTYETAQS